VAGRNKRFDLFFFMFLDSWDMPFYISTVVIPLKVEAGA